MVTMTVQACSDEDTGNGSGKENGNGNGNDSTKGKEETIVIDADDSVNVSADAAIPQAPPAKEMEGNQNKNASSSSETGKGSMAMVKATVKSTITTTTASPTSVQPNVQTRAQPLSPLAALHQTQNQIHNHWFQNIFSIRLQQICKSYTPSPKQQHQRRAIQACILLEADRHYHKRRDSDLIQRCKQILNSLTWIHPDYKPEILYRTMTKKIPFTSELAYKKVRMIQKEIKDLLIPAVMESDVYNNKNSHQENCVAYLQKEFEKAGNGKGKPYTPDWLYKININFLAYIMLYKGAVLDPDLPYPIFEGADMSAIAPFNTVRTPQRNVARTQNLGGSFKGTAAAAAAVVTAASVSLSKSKSTFAGSHYTRHTPTATKTTATGNTNKMAASQKTCEDTAKKPRRDPSPVTAPEINGNDFRAKQQKSGKPDETSRKNQNNKKRKRQETDEELQIQDESRVANNVDLVRRISSDGERASRERRSIIQEIRDHLDVLKEFEGVVSERELQQRKVELFHSLPLPPSIGTDV